MPEQEFNPSRLTLAMMRRRSTAVGLAKAAGLRPETVRRLQKGLQVPDSETVSALCRELRYPYEFFHEEVFEEIDTDAVSFRSFSKMSAKERDAAIAAGSLGIQLSNYVEGIFNLPQPNLLDMSDEINPSLAAYSIRQFWNLGEKPIDNMVALLETRGIRVFSLAENTATVNAFSFWRDNTAFIFLNNFKTAESSIFDAAHELGHLVLHKKGDIRGIRSVEREANDFASAFLMPENDVKSYMPRYINADTIISMKKRWRVSAMALARRVYTLGRITEWQYKSLCIELGRRKYRDGEPITVGREKSRVWQKVLTELWKQRVTKADIARRLHLPMDELEGLIWGLTADAEPPARPLEALKTAG